MGSSKEKRTPHQKTKGLHRIKGREAEAGNVGFPTTRAHGSSRYRDTKHKVEALENENDSKEVGPRVGKGSVDDLKFKQDMSGGGFAGCLLVSFS